MKRPPLILAVGLAAAVTLTACGEADAEDDTAAAADATPEQTGGDPTAAAVSEAPAEPALQVAAAFYPLEFLAREVGGERVEVVGLTPPGAEAHDVELTAESLVALTEADLLLYLDTFQPAVDDAVGQREGPSVDLGQVATREYAEEEEHAHEDEAHSDEEEHAHEDEAHSDEEEHAHEDEAHSDEEEHAHGSTDPHFWTDPTAMVEAAGVVQEALTEADPEGADAYAANAEELVADLQALDATAMESLASCEITTLVTSHEAFGYFADRYGFESEPISGLSPEDEPSPAELAAITDLVQERGITTVYTETLIPSDLADTVAAETGATTAVLDPVEGLTDESPGEDYLEVMAANIETVATGQQCA